MDTDETPETPQDEPESPAVTEAPIPPQTQLEATYHVLLWSTPPSFLCLRCSLQGVSHDVILSHVTTEHGLEPVPTPLAAQYLANNVAVFGLVLQEEPTDERVDDSTDTRAPAGEPVAG